MSEVVSHVRNAKRFAVSGWIVMFLCLGASSLYARSTWKLIHQFDRSIGCGYFFDENHGLIGSGVRWWLGSYPGSPAAIYKTTDGGTTWTATTVPTTIVGAVTSIWMEDSLTGYASILPSIDYSANGTYGRSSLWKTTDGGNTWFIPFPFDHAVSSVYAQNGILIITKWDWADFSSFQRAPPDQYGGDYSYDGGTTWTPNFGWCDDVAFSDSLNGVVTEMNQLAPGGNFWYTIDAGRTWQSTSANQYEAWTVYALPGQRTYFCANEAEPNIPHTMIDWSTDGGKTWSIRASFPVIHFTGGIAGVGNTIYVQTDSTDYGDVYQRGLYRSDDLGANWHWVGGPTNSRDTRFVVTGCEGQVVYAFDGLGGVWKTTDGGDGTLGPSVAFAEPDTSIAFAADTIRWVPKSCGDTLNFQALCSSCIPVSIDSAAIFWGTELSPVPEPGTLPAALEQNDSARIRVAYVPTKGGVQGTIVRVFAHNGEEHFYKDITIVTTNTLTNAIALSKDTCALSVGGCNATLDSVDVFDAGCLGLVVDSVTTAASDVRILTPFPAAASDSASLRLLFLYQPHQAEVQTVPLHLFAHEGLRSFDTVITLELQSTIAPPSFALDSTSYSLFTSLCHPDSRTITISVSSCDSVRIDSVISSAPQFLLTGDSTVIPGIGDSLRLTFAPDSAGTQTGTIRIVAHNGYQPFDTTLAVTGTNTALTNSVVLSTSAISLAAAHCLSAEDTLRLTNLCCQVLLIDSIQIEDDSEVSILYDPSQLPVASDGTLAIRILLVPLDGTTKTSSVKVFMHAGAHSFDTVLTLTTSGIIPAHPLSLSQDSLYLFTKYCQPVSAPILITDSGCDAITIDSEAILNDTFGEFRAASSRKVFTTSDSSNITFIPSADGDRIVKLEIWMQQGARKFDTILSIAAKNLTAPVPTIPPLPSLGAGTVLAIPIVLEPTADTFSIRHFAFHLSFNTDLLTPFGLAFPNTLSSNVRTYNFVAEPGSGCSGEVWLADTISDTSQLSSPLIFVLDSVSVALDSTTAVMLDSFTTDGEATMQLCSIPEQIFRMAPFCGDPLMRDAMGGKQLTFDIRSIVPNPGSVGNWNIGYGVNGGAQELTLEVVGVTGDVLYRSTFSGAVGVNNISVPVPQHPGMYVISITNGWSHKARTAMVVR